MCGISGFVGSRFRPDHSQSVIRAMCSAIRHRGPDDEGYYADGEAVLGIRRLSIIDLAGGHQPVCNEDETIWTVFNGEIYNYLDLRTSLLERGHHFKTRSDTEVIVHLFEEADTRAIEQLDGMFALAIWDRKQKRLVLARDRMGKKPLHYAVVGHELIFGSELKALLQHPRVPRQLSMGALSRYLVHDYVPTPVTIFRHIAKLPPAHWLVYERGEARLTQYWDLPGPDGGPPLNEEEAARQLRLLLEAATRRRLMSDVPLGAFLSGGIDSSAVVALMARTMPERVKTFNIGFAEPTFDESAHARRVAAYLGTDHHEDIMTPTTLIELVSRINEVLDEPMGDASVLPTYLVARFARQHVTVALSGDGGDELFAGYPTYQAHCLARVVAAAPRPLRAAAGMMVERLPVSHANLSLDFKMKKFFSGLGYAPELRHAVWLGSFSPGDLPALLTPEVWREAQTDDLFSEVRAHARAAQGRDWLATLLYLDAKMYLQDGVLVKVDRASMACSLEVRCPYLDTAVVTFASRLPGRRKLRGLTTKYLLKRSLRGLLPPEILRRPKKGFGVPLGSWIRSELSALFHEALAPSRLAEQGILRPGTVGRLMQEHAAGRRDHRKKLWNLFVFQAWYRRYVDGHAA
jgi:asparagine synthase (glutamine-hydrolysing)